MTVPAFAYTAVNFAKSKVGDAYVWGAAGPNTWDCSGLMMRAWEAAGYQLPHNSLEQCDATARVYANHLVLEPGDLVFYYLPISHVGMYIGRNRWGQQLVCQASAPGLGVQIIKIAQYAKPVACGRVKYPGWDHR